MPHTISKKRIYGQKSIFIILSGENLIDGGGSTAIVFIYVCE